MTGSSSGQQSSLGTGRPTQRSDFNLSELKQRGWSTVAVKKFLGDPDSTRPNPVRKTAAPMKLYGVTRVQEAEATEGFRAWKEKAAKRSAATKATAARKRKELEAWVDKQRIRVPKLSEEKLVEKAIESYNTRAWDRGQEGDASKTSDKAFLRRLCVNCLRHEMTKYEALLDKTKGRIGVREAYVQIKLKVLDAIAEVYPDLAPECEAQKQRERASRDEYGMMP